MSAEIRRVQDGDVDALMHLIHAHAAFEQGRALIRSQELRELIDHNDPPVRLLLATHAGRAVGYAAVSFDFSLWRAGYFAHLDCLFVDAQARGAGLGRSLLRAAMELARAAGAKEMEWQTPEWNADAIRFYEREGARGLAKRRFSIMLDRNAEL